MDMKFRMGFAAFLLTAIAVSPCPPRQAMMPLPINSRSGAANWADAAKKQDAGPLEAMLAEDYTLTEAGWPGGARSKKSVFVEKLKRWIV